MNKITATYHIVKLVLMFPIDVIRRYKINSDYDKWLKEHTRKRRDIY